MRGVRRTVHADRGSPDGSSKMDETGIVPDQRCCGLDKNGGFHKFRRCHASDPIRFAKARAERAEPFLFALRTEDDDIQIPFLDDPLDKVEIALQDLVHSPERWPVVEADVRRRIIRRFPYSLLYRIDPGEIVILAVMHQKRHPSYWLPRRQLK